MSKYVVTDPCYIIDDDVWSDICKRVFSVEHETREQCDIMYANFDKEVSKALRDLSGYDKALASGTGIGDWSNSLQGPNIEHNKFFADAGMVCVCKYTEPVKKALSDLHEDGYALFEASDNITISFDTSDKSWTMVNIKDNDSNEFWESELPYEDEEDEDDDYYSFEEDEE